MRCVEGVGDFLCLMQFVLKITIHLSLHLMFQLGNFDQYNCLYCKYLPTTKPVKTIKTPWSALHLLLKSIQKTMKQKIVMAKSDLY